MADQWVLKQGVTIEAALIARIGPNEVFQQPMHPNTAKLYGADWPGHRK